MRLPWSKTRKPRLTGDWRGHTAVGLAWDFGREKGPDGTYTSIDGMDLLAPSSGYVRAAWDTKSTYGNYVDIQQEEEDGWAVRLAHLQDATPKPGASPTTTLSSLPIAPQYIGS